VVVTWNSADEVRQLLESAERHLGRGWELIFVDNDSEDGTVETIRRTAPDSRLIELPENRGFAAANNLGVREAEAEVIVLLNPDTILVDASLAELAAQASRQRALLGARLLNEDGSPQISAWAPVGSWEAGLSAIWPGALMPPAIRRRCEPFRYEERLPAGWLSAACLAARRDLMLELGPFDDRLVLYGEDTDLCVRARSLGVPCLFAPDLARVVHLGGRSGSKRFADVGMRRKVLARRWVARERLGRIRGAYDFGAQLLFHLSRWALKRVLRRDAAYEAAWLRAGIAVLRSPREEPGALTES
jgi:GT2 family glycosyltransferase